MNKNYRANAARFYLVLSVALLLAELTCVAVLSKPGTAEAASVQTLDQYRVWMLDAKRVYPYPQSLDDLRDLVEAADGVLGHATSSPKKRIAFPPMIFLRASALNGRPKKYSGWSKSWCGQSEANMAWFSPSKSSKRSSEGCASAPPARCPAEGRDVQEDGQHAEGCEHDVVLEEQRAVENDHEDIDRVRREVAGEQARDAVVQCDPGGDFTGVPLREEFDGQSKDVPKESARRADRQTHGDFG